MWLDSKSSKSLLGFEPVSDRLIRVRLAGKPRNVTLIQVHAPTNQADEAEKTSFYNQLQGVLDSVPSGDALFVLGDFNAKIGVGSEIGKHSIGVENENGQRLVHFALQNDLVAANAWRSGHLRRKYTWKSPDGVHRNQIDFIFMRRAEIEEVGRCRSFPGADTIQTDHVLVDAKVSFRLYRRP